MELVTFQKFFQCVASSLRRFNLWITGIFYNLGYCIGRSPSYFILVPIFISLLGFSRLQTITQENDPEYLYSPEGGKGQMERESIEKLFPMNYTSFDPSVMIGIPLGYARILVSAKEDNVLTVEPWDEIVLLDTMIRNVTIELEDGVARYEDICALRNGACIKNEILDLTEHMPQIANGTFGINYPLMLIPRIGPGFYGNPVVDEENHVLISSKAIVLGYFVRAGRPSEKERAKEWEDKVLALVLSSQFQHIIVDIEVSVTLERELVRNVETVTPYYIVNFVLMFSFSCISMWSMDWVRSKCGLGAIGIFSALFSILASFGLLATLGVPFTALNMAILFLILGIGLDDQYVMISGWRRTKMTDEVPVRLAETFSEAAISITITSLTNAASFFIGVTTSLPAVRLFCIYAAVTVLFSYWWFLCIFGGCLALAGRAEAKNKHCLTTRVVQPKSLSNESSVFYRYLCSGGINTKDPDNTQDNQNPVVTSFFQNYLAKLILNPFFRGGVFVVFIAYLTGAIYGLSHMVQGLEREDLVVDGSYLYRYHQTDKMFKEFPYRVQVVINETLTYSDPTVEKQIFELHDKFHESKFVGRKIYTQSAIRQFYRFLRPRPHLRANITDEISFIDVLKKHYFVRNKDAERDFLFNSDGTQIQSSRFVIQAIDVHNSTSEVEWTNDMRTIAKNAPFKAFVYHPYFIFMDQYTMTLSSTIKAIVYATVSMGVISIILMPNILCCCAVLFSIVSIEIGVMGYMSLWSVNMDSIAMINVIMCIGFSVDFSAHISYAYVSSRAGTMEERLQNCLGQLGVPILQGGISTILGVITLSVVPSYTFRVFFKIIFLVILFGMVHSLFLLPVLFTLISPIIHSSESSSQGSTSTLSLGDIKKSSVEGEKEIS